MNQKEIKELIDYLVEKDIAEFEFERGDVKLKVKRGSIMAAPSYVAVEAHPVAAPAPAAVAHAPAAPAASAASASAGAGPAAQAEGEEDAGLHIVRSPIVGTFYEAPSPGAPPFVKVGDSISNGQVLCIIEAMKLMNEIETEVSGDIIKRYVQNAQPVEYGQPLFGIRPR